MAVDLSLTENTGTTQHFPLLSFNTETAHRTHSSFKREVQQYCLIFYPQTVPFFLCESLDMFWALHIVYIVYKHCHLVVSQTTLYILKGMIE